MNIYYKKIRYLSIVIFRHVDERYIDKSANIDRGVRGHEGEHVETVIEERRNCRFRSASRT